MNDLLDELGILVELPTSIVVSGQVSREDGLPFAGGVVRAFHETREASIRLGEDRTDTDGRYTVCCGQLPDVSDIVLWVSVSGEDGTVLATSEVRRQAGSWEMVDLTVPLLGVSLSQRRVEGRVVLEHGLPAEAMMLRLYHREFGNAEPMVMETATRAGGQHALPHEWGDTAANFKIRAVDAAGRETSLSTTMHDLEDGPRAAVTHAKIMTPFGYLWQFANGPTPFPLKAPEELVQKVKQTVAYSEVVGVISEFLHS